MDNLIHFFQALGDSNRIRIVNLLLYTGELCVCDIERVLAIPQTRVSRHLLFLKHAGFVSSRRSGQWMHYGLLHDSTIPENLYDQLKQAFATVPELVADRKKLRSTRDLVCCITLPSNPHEKIHEIAR